eukprot:TRINITY_DN22547_c0_g1_i1.p1 TRINITY_DN22547_c0_g1~~TRINITY_DN22547_c0_g1_i1.p1  ORF type:complete len:682 (+),score=178.20 TRINITY_DN22547_c0_g1_i1:153-2048(+)
MAAQFPSDSSINRVPTVAAGTDAADPFANVAPPAPRPPRRPSSPAQHGARSSPRPSISELCFDDAFSDGSLPDGGRTPGGSMKLSFVSVVTTAMGCQQAGLSKEGGHRMLPKWLLACAIIRKQRRDKLKVIMEVCRLRKRRAVRVYNWIRRARTKAVDRRYRAMRDRIVADALEAGVQMEMEPGKEGKINYRLQGALDLQDPEVLRVRCGLRTHKDVEEAIARIWDSMPYCPSPHENKIDRQIYQWMSLRILDDLLPKQTQGLHVRQTLDVEWWQESQMNFFMDYKLFFDAMFDFIDVWAETTDASEYVALAKGVVHSVGDKHSFVYSGKLARRHFKEWLGRGDRKKGGPLNPEEFPWSDAAMLHHNRILAARRSNPGTPTEQALSGEVSPGRIRPGDRARRSSSPCNSQGDARRGSAPVSPGGRRGSSPSAQGGMGGRRGSSPGTPKDKQLGGRRTSTGSNASAGVAFGRRASAGSACSGASAGHVSKEELERRDKEHRKEQAEKQRAKMDEAARRRDEHRQQEQAKRRTSSGGRRHSSASGSSGSSPRRVSSAEGHVPRHQQALADAGSPRAKVPPQSPVPASGLSAPADDVVHSQVAPGELAPHLAGPRGPRPGGGRGGPIPTPPPPN